MKKTKKSKKCIIVLGILLFTLLLVSCTKITPINEKNQKEITNFDNNIIQDLCDYNESDKFEPTVRISEDEEYYQVSMFMKLLTQTHPPKVSKIPATDLPVLYYKKNGQLSASCGGFIAGANSEASSSLCEAFSKLEFGQNLCEKNLHKIISMEKGKLILEYEDNAIPKRTILSGALFRSTPCVDWIIGITTTNDFPVTNVNIDIEEYLKEMVCIQVVGEPQEINEIIENVDENTNYKVVMDEVVMDSSVIFSGKLKKELKVMDNK